MSLRRAALLVLTSALFACTDAEQDGAPDELVTVAQYSPSRADPADCAAPAPSPNIPLPNDLALQRAAGLPEGIQRELLFSFIAQGGWPSDQAQPITLPIYRRTRDAATGAYVPAVGPAGIDAATLNESTVALLRTDGAAIERVPFTTTYAPPAAGAPAGTPGVLRIAPTSGRWAAGARYVAAIRAGGNGVKTADGVELGADSPIALIAPDRDLSIRENQPLGNIPDAACSPAGNADEVRTLETLRNVYGTPKVWTPIPDAAVCNAQAGIPVAPCWLPVPPPAGANVPSAFDAVATVFPHEEIASIQTFTTQAGTRPVTDAAGGSVPLPSDFLLDPATGKVRNVPSFGPAAAGLATLDGFSTTAPLLIPLSGPVSAAPASVNRDNVRIYKIGAGGALTQLRDQSALPGATPQIITQPAPFIATVGGQPVATTLALAPAVPVPLPPPAPAGTVVPVPPLDEKSRYLVIVTNDVVDAAGDKLQRSTLMNILFSFESPLYDDKGTPDTADDVNHAAALGISAGDARGLQALREGLTPALTALNLDSCDNNARCAVLAYTVTTQNVTDVSLKLAAAPYSIETGASQAIFTPSAADPVTPPAGVPTAGIAGFYSVTFNSLDAIDKVTGALRPTLEADLANPGPLLAPLQALVAVPEAAAVPACPSPPFPAGARCAKLVIVGHGFNGSKETLFAVASSLASRGFLAAAIDLPLHGGRNWCTANADCTTGTADGVCTPFAGAQQGDAAAPGTCTTGAPKPGNSRFFVSSNFFRTRDAFRQNVLDQSALALALSRPPGLPTPAGNPFAAVLPAGVIVDPSAVYYEGVSLGSIAGTSVVATNPRISRAVLSVGGGTVVDVFTNSPAYQANVDALFAGLIPGFTRAKVTAGDPAFDPAIAASYAQTLSVAKWILDPADPVNYAAHVQAAPLPNLLANPAGTVAQSPKPTFTQVAKGDAVVPNPFNFLLDNLIDPATVVTYVDTDPAGGDVPHGMIGNLPEVQTDAAQFLVDTTVPESPRPVVVQ